LTSTLKLEATGARRARQEVTGANVYDEPDQ
jgi:hypothetical protein